MIASLRSTVRWALIVLCLFQAVSALGGGVGILVADGMGMPAHFLEGGPFTSFVWPGLILLVVVGGTQAVSAGLLLRRRESGLLWSAVAGFGMIIWIFVETVMIGGFSWLQALYFITGIAQLTLVLTLLGLVAWLPRAALRAGRADNGTNAPSRPETAAGVRETRATSPRAGRKDTPQ